MGEIDYRTKREIIEELLYKDRYFFSEHDSEFDIFKYTALFAVLTFTFQFVIVIMDNLYGLSYLTFSQLLLSMSSLVFMVALIQLYFGLTRAIKKSTHRKKGVYLRLNSCRNCDFTSYSEFNSNLHIVSYPDHTLTSKQIFVAFERYNKPPFLRFSVISRQSKLKELYDPDLTILSGSDRRIESEITDGHGWINANVKVAIAMILFGLVVLAALTFLYFLFKSTLLTISMLLIIVFCLLISTYVETELVKGDITSVYLCKMNLIDREEKRNPKITFKFYTVGSSYWEHVKKETVMDPIEVHDGSLYIIDKIVLNKFGELTEVYLE